MRQNRSIRFQHKNRIHASCYFVVCAILSFFLCFFTYSGKRLTVYADESKESQIVFQTGNTKINVTLGIDGIIRYGRTLQVSAEIFEVTEKVEGRLAVTCINQDGVNSQYSRSFTTETGEETKIMVPVSINGYTEALLVQVIGNEKVIAEQQVDLLAVNYGNYEVIGLLSETPEALSYFESFGSKTVALEKETLPETLSGLDFMDMIVVDNFDISSLSEPQIEALTAFVKSGRTIVFGSGEHGIASMSAFLDNGTFNLGGNEEEILEKEISLIPKDEADVLCQKISDYENERITILSRNESSMNQEKGIQKMYAGTSMIKEGSISDFIYQAEIKKVATFTVEDALVVAKMDGMPLLWRLSLGKGTIEIASFSFSDPNTTDVTFFQAGVVSTVLENQSDTAKERLQNELYGFSSRYLLSNVLEHSDTDKMPSISIYVVVIIFYILLIGPVLYLILHKKRRQQFLYLLVPMLSVLFFSLLFLVGKKTRIEEAYAGYINIEQYEPKSQTMNGEVAFTISLPFMKKHEITLGQTSTLIVGRDSFPYYSDYSAEYITKAGNDDENGREYTQGVAYDSDTASIIVQDTRAFSKNYFYATYHAQACAPLEGKITMTPEGISGMITNVSDDSLTEAYLYCNGALVSLGELKGKETVETEGKDTDFIGNRDMLYFSDIILELAEEKTEEVTEEDYRKEYAIQYILGELYEKNGQAYVIAFKEEPDSNIPIASILNRRGGYGNSMVVVPIDVDYISDQGAFVPYMDQYLHVIEGTFDNDSYRYLLADTIVLKYYFPDSEKVTAIYYSKFFNRTASESYIPQFSGDIYFRNKVTGEYDRIFCSGGLENVLNDKELLIDTLAEQPEHVIGINEGWTLEEIRKSSFEVDMLQGEMLKDYLGEDQVLEVKIKQNSSDLIYSQILPYLSYSGEVR